jgi:hypothetical protein
MESKPYNIFERRVRLHISSIERLSAEETIDFEYTYEELKKFYLTCVLLYAEIQTYFETCVESVNEYLFKMLNNQLDYISYPLSILCVNKGVYGRTIDSHKKFAKKNDQIPLSAIAQFRSQISKNSGIEISNLKELFVPIGFFDFVKNEEQYTDLKEDLRRLSKLRHQGAHKSIQLKKGIDHNPNHIIDLCENLIKGIKMFDRKYHSYIENHFDVSELYEGIE